MLTILSTKKLAINQKMLLLNAGVFLVEYDAIQIESVPFKIPRSVENAIITSQNTIPIILDSFPTRQKKIQNCFCVGLKTMKLLQENGLEVIKMTEYASELAEYIVKYHKDDHFHFFCGNIRSDEIPSTLKNNNISFEEIEVYKTTLTYRTFERQFDAVLFFSPSGVRSYFQTSASKTFLKSCLSETLAVCIGTTTASEAKKFTENILIANSTTIESVISKAVNSLKRNTN